MSTNRKEIIAQNFSANILTYETHAKIQNQVAQRLCDLVRVNDDPDHILEIGCGTGFLTEKLIQKFPNAHITAIDTSAKMVEHCQQKFKDLTITKMDGETLNFDQKFDLIVSNMTIQWFENLEDSINKIKEYLVPNGQLFYSTIGENNFQEWQETLEKLSLQNGLIEIPEYQDIIKEESLKENHSSAKEFLKFIRKIGAHHPREGYKKLTSSQLEKACAKFDQTHKGAISWHILYGHFQRH